MITLQNIQTEESLKSLLSPTTDPDVIKLLGDLYDPEILHGYFNIGRLPLSITYNPNSSKPWTVDGVIANMKRYKSFPSARTHLTKIREV